MNITAVTPARMVHAIGFRDRQRSCQRWSYPAVDTTTAITAAIPGGLAHNEETDQRYHRLWRVAVGNRHPDSCRAATSVAIANHGTRINYASTGAKSRRRAFACSAAAIADTARRSS